MTKRILAAAAATTALTMISSSVIAGGFAVREQSATLMGMAFAGAASGVDLSSAYWNPAAFGIAEAGLTTESHYALILANTEITGQVVNDGSAPAPPPVAPFVNGALDGVAAAANAGPASSSIDRPAIVGASYGAYRLSDKLVLGVSMNAPFGLSSEPNSSDYAGRGHGLNSSLFTLNLTPTLAYEVVSGVHIAAGVQLQFADLAFKFASIIPDGLGGAIQPGNSEIDVTDEIGVGFTLGILLEPANGTKIGVGFRSKVSHNFEGELGIPGRNPTDVSADLDLPEILTVSLSQALSPTLRVHATYEWTNWSRFDSTLVTGTSTVDLVNGTLAALEVPGAAQEDRSLDGPWEDGHFVSGGLEYDMNAQLTLRTGVAWEKSPVQTPEARLLQVPDTDRVWVAFGASYKYSEMTTIDFGYTHIFFKDEDINRAALSAEPLVFQGSVDNSADIIAVSVRTKWGENGLQDMLASLLGGGGE